MTQKRKFPIVVTSCIVFFAVWGALGASVVSSAYADVLGGDPGLIAKSAQAPPSPSVAMHPRERLHPMDMTYRVAKTLVKGDFPHGPGASVTVSRLGNSPLTQVTTDCVGATAAGFPPPIVIGQRTYSTRTIDFFDCAGARLTGLNVPGRRERRVVRKRRREAVEDGHRFMEVLLNRGRKLRPHGQRRYIQIQTKNMRTWFSNGAEAWLSYRCRSKHALRSVGVKQNLATGLWEMHLIECHGAVKVVAGLHLEPLPPPQPPV